MILNKNNYFARYYNWIYGDYPKDICSFFWGSVLAILLAPLILPGKKLTSLSDKYDENLHSWGLQSVVGLLIYLFILLFASIGNALLDAFGYEFIYWWSIVLGGFSLGILAVALIVGISTGIVWFFSKKAPETHLVSNTVDLIAAIKGKYCTRITWK